MERTTDTQTKDVRNEKKPQIKLNNNNNDSTEKQTKQKKMSGPNART